VVDPRLVADNKRRSVIPRLINSDPPEAAWLRLANTTKRPK
jgi:hypothetical protein